MKITQIRIGTLVGYRAEQKVGERQITIIEPTREKAIAGVLKDLASIEAPRG